MTTMMRMLRYWLLSALACVGTAGAFCPPSSTNAVTAPSGGVVVRPDETRCYMMNRENKLDDDDHTNGHYTAVAGGTDASSSSLVTDDQRRTLLGAIGAGAVGLFTATQGVLAKTATAAATTLAPVVPTPPTTSDLTWPLGKVAFSLLPLAGTSTRRATVEETVVPNQIWTHDQIQGVVNVNVPVRQTVVKLSKEAGGGLWVYNPVAPTPQLLSMMKNLEAQHGPVRHMVLGTVALEHKATFGAFARQFPKATVWIQPGEKRSCWAMPVCCCIPNTVCLSLSLSLSLLLVLLGTTLSHRHTSVSSMDNICVAYSCRPMVIPHWSSD